MDTSQLAMDASKAWHAAPASEALEALRVDAITGLSEQEARARLSRFGPNRLAESRRRSLLRIVLGQFNDFMIFVLAGAAIVSGLVGSPKDALVIVVIILLNAAIGFVQEYRAENAVAALKTMAAPHARVRRDGGEIKTLDAEAVALGDIVLLEAGAIVPADLRLTESAALQCGEAVLTGESAAVDKEAAALAKRNDPIGERRNMAYKGSLVTHGRGAGVVVATGASTEFGKIAGLMSGAEDARSPLQRRLAEFGARLAWVVLAICAVVFIAGVLRGEPPVMMLLTAISLAVAAIPEALPAVISIALAIGAFRMARRHALIRRLSAVETLGSVTFICTDKTGTLTENRMRVESVWTPAPPSLESETHFYRALALCNDARLGRDGAIGDPTEIALLEAAAARDFIKADLEVAAPRFAELPFSAQRRRMSTLHRDGAGAIAYVKGAVEAIAPRLASCVFVEALQREADAMARTGLRVMAVAERRFATPPDELQALEQELELLGLVGLADPPRAGVKEAIAECQTAGITPVMITGDHGATARAIAHRLGIVGNLEAAVVTGSELAELSDGELAARARDVRIYARMDPAQKIRIVEALQARGEYVAMTGDGVNDAPALKRAEIGVAMGRDGSDVARESAHMILTDDNFATIVRAIREGRRIYDNVRKFIRYTMTSNSGEIWTIFLAPLIGLPIPLLPIHILWINLVTDGLPGLALAGERAEGDIMRRPPRPPRESVFAHGMAWQILWTGFLMGAVCLCVQAGAARAGSLAGSTMVFTVLTLSQLGNCLATRSDRRLLTEIGVFSNPGLIWIVLGTAAVQICIVYAPPLQSIFHTQALTLAELSVCLAASGVVFMAVETSKLLRRHRSQSY